MYQCSSIEWEKIKDLIPLQNSLHFFFTVWHILDIKHINCNCATQEMKSLTPHTYTEIFFTLFFFQINSYNIKSDSWLKIPTVSIFFFFVFIVACYDKSLRRLLIEHTTNSIGYQYITIVVEKQQCAMHRLSRD